MFTLLSKAICHVGPLVLINAEPLELRAYVLALQIMA